MRKKKKNQRKARKWFKVKEEEERRGRSVGWKQRLVWTCCQVWSRWWEQFFLKKIQGIGFERRKNEEKSKRRPSSGMRKSRKRCTMCVQTSKSSSSSLSYACVRVWEKVIDWIVCPVLILVLTDCGSGGGGSRFGKWGQKRRRKSRDAKNVKERERTWSVGGGECKVCVGIQIKDEMRANKQLSTNLQQTKTVLLNQHTTAPTSASPLSHIIAITMCRNWKNTNEGNKLTSKRISFVMPHNGRRRLRINNSYNNWLIATQVGHNWIQLNQANQFTRLKDWPEIQTWHFLWWWRQKGFPMRLSKARQPKRPTSCWRVPFESLKTNS